MSRHWRVALVQASPLKGEDPVAELAAELAAILAERPDTQMVVFPEIHLLGASDGAADTGSYFDAVAEPLTGPLVRALGAVAVDAGVWLLPGSIAERGEDGRVYNTALVFDPDGRLVSSYRKVFPWRPHEPWASGAGFTAFDVPGVGRMGVNICYDSWFPEATRQIAWLGAEVVFNIVKTTSDDRAQELVLARANAITNQIYYLSVNAAGPLGRGQSIYVGPEGEVLAQAAHAEPEVTHLTIDLDQVTAVRTRGTAGVNRMWEQLHADDDPIELPAYAGQLVHQRWQPQPVDPEGRS
ncbi:MAG: carbon-nitrogen hydrolase family protein [Mycolicibacterium sp.]|uniref:carbon-nitrogen hydrolase family protein n=1 Tax=Mycolicibacterium sp. TaxID=2320850 RepID=UPI000FB32440|nr:carbon-nitrogen hydrolase family protein [Mycolicibacterium sp.]RUP34904.1 MAG: carbon-nitrogen hydrolase family protein [Mycolicibacterium sp.]